MNSVDETDLRTRLHAALDPTVPSEQFDERVLRTVRNHTAPRRPRRIPRRFALALTSAGVVAVFTIALVTGLGLRGHRSPSSPGWEIDTVPESVFGTGPPAVVGPSARASFVWLMGAITQPSAGPTPGKLVGEAVNVIDWTGALRYQFQLPTPPGASGPPSVQSISADGTRALLTDGTVLDESGAAVAHMPASSAGGLLNTSLRWANDGSLICDAVSNEPTPPAPQPTPPGASPSPPSLPPYALPGADHSVSLRVVAPDGTARVVATVGGGALGEPSGIMPDSTSVLSCTPSADIAVIARYHDATNPSGEQTATNMTASIWAIRLSTGKVLFHQPETRTALGRPFFFGSQTGNLAVEYLWNSVTLGSEVDRVIHIPSGQAVPDTEADPAPDTPSVSADGSRILRRFYDPQRNLATLEVLDSSDGRVIRRFQLTNPPIVSAVAEPHGAVFLVQVGGQLVLIDQDGRSTILQVRGDNGVGLAPLLVPPMAPNVQG